MATTSALSLEWFLAQPETKPYSEYAQGEVVQKPMPELDHGALQIYLAYLLVGYLRNSKQGRAYTELRCVFGPSGDRRAYVPDVAVIVAERVTRGGHFRAAPDIAVEVLSPGQPDQRFREKLSFYLVNGVRLVWVVDPKRETIQVLSPGQEPVTLSPGDALDGGDVLPGFQASLTEVFAQLHEE